jgi:hypothetical protein
MSTHTLAMIDNFATTGTHRQQQQQPPPKQTQRESPTRAPSDGLSEALAYASLLHPAAHRH